MKISRAFCLLLISGLLIVPLTTPLIAQNVGMGSVSFAASSKAMLELKSTTSGLLIPRMTNAQRTTLAPGAAANVGLLIFQTDAGATTPTGIGFYYWNGTIWVPLLANANSTIGAWDLRGNAGTVDGTNFLGTTDNVALSFWVNNQKSGSIDPAGPVYLGYQAGIGNTSANTTAIGFMALFGANTGADNLAIGNQVLNSNTTGSQNTGIGDYSLNSSVGGSNNTAIGFEAALFVSASGTGNNNTAIGSDNFYQSQSGSDNTIIGFNAAQQTDGGNYNTAVGSNTMLYNIGGSGNTSLGYSASPGGNNLYYDVAIGYQTGPGASGSSNDVYVGANAGVANVGGSGGVFIGSGATSSSGGLFNVTAIGYNVSVSASNTMVFGNSSITKWGFGANASAGNILEFNNALTTACLTTGGVWTNASDSTLKRNIKPLNYGLNEIMRLRPVSYTLKKNGRNDIGFLAQEVKEVIPEIVYGESGNMSMSYGQLTAVLVKAMKEQKKTLEELQATFEQLQHKVAEMKRIALPDDALLKASK